MVANVTPSPFSEILVSSHHVSGDLNQFVALSSGGTVLGEYWHAGHLTRLDAADLYGDGREEIILGGFNSRYHQATLVILDPAKLAASPVRAKGDPHVLQGFGVAAEKGVLFPRTCLNSQFEEFNWVRSLTVREGFVNVGVSERHDEPEQQVVYTLDKTLRVTDARFSDRLMREHRRLEAAGTIHHALSATEIEKFRQPLVSAGPAVAN
jgi:hypothetical protein